MNKIMLGFVLFCVCMVSQASNLPKTQAVPGGVNKLPIIISSPNAPIAYYSGHRVSVVKNNDGQWLAVVGIPLSAKIGKQIVQVSSPVNSMLVFDIHKTHYQVQKLTIKNKRKVTPLPQDTGRIQQEHKTVKNTLAHWSDKIPFQQALSAPLKGIITSTFGLRRVYNGKPRSPHTGVDIAAPSGTPVKAPASGIVIATGDYFYTGNTVILDHGQGFMTLYAHLKTIDVKPGRHVAAGNVIGSVGQTGRVTGPHLHWTVILNQTKVNPLLFIDRNAIYKAPDVKKSGNSALQRKKKRI